MEDLTKRITQCERCPRLRSYCKEIAKTKRRSFLQDEYWGKPVPGFGDIHARLVIVGLAPAAHGANRTGRMFTGDNSGVWLYRALYKAGFSNQEHSTWRNDTLELRDAYITAVVRCAPPDNRPSPDEISRCSSYLKEELSLLKNAKICLALGQIALNGLCPLLELKKPKFIHGAEVALPGGQHLLMSYHPSQQNTFTKRLTEPMFDAIFSRARALLR